RGVWRKVPEGLSRVLSCAFLLYVWGFFVFRARLHALGVPSSPIPMVDQTYLIHGGRFLAGSLELIVSNVPYALILIGLVAGGAYWIHHQRQVAEASRPLQRWRRTAG